MADGHHNGISVILLYCTTFSIRRYVYENYKTDISFEVAQGTLLW